MIAPSGDDGLDPVFFAKCLVAADELDLNAGLDGELLVSVWTSTGLTLPIQIVHF